MQKNMPYYGDLYDIAMGREGNTSLPYTWIVAAVILGALIGFVLYSVIFRGEKYKKEQDKKGKIYNYIAFNRFYGENIVRFLYLICASIITAIGIAELIGGSIIIGLGFIVLLNLFVRLAFELAEMFILLCKKTVLIEKRLERIEPQSCNLSLKYSVVQTDENEVVQTDENEGKEKR